MVVTALLWPLYLRSRIRTLSEEDALAFRRAAESARSAGPDVSTVVAVVISICAILGLAYVIHPLVAVVILGWALGVQVALVWWCRTARRVIPLAEISEVSGCQGAFRGTSSVSFLLTSGRIVRAYPILLAHSRRYALAWDIASYLDVKYVSHENRGAR